MHTSIQRIQQTFSQGSTVLSVVAAFIFVVSYIQLLVANVWSLPDATFNLRGSKAARRFSRQYGANDPKKGKENVALKFDLDADLSPLFNWNTKLVFAYLTATYDGKREDIVNEVTIWDQIITDKEDAHIQLKAANSKYSLYDVEESFRNRNATVRLHWNIQPHVGAKIYGALDATKGSIKFPQLV